MCCWLDNLAEVAISRANWQAQLEACDFEDGSDEYKVWQVICSEVTTDKQWCAFLDALGNAYPLAQLGVQDCPCDECEDWEHTIDFTASNGSFTASPANRALWTNGAGWGRGTALNYAVQMLSPTYASFVLKGVKVTLSSALVGRRLGQFRVPNVSGTVYDVTVPSGATEFTIMLPSQRETTTLWVGVDTYNTTYNGKITTLTIYGCGYNPFI
jgi:hypothetical protein